MNRIEWENKIKDNCITAGTYRPFFDAIIATLAGILERRDEVEKEYNDAGAVAVVEHVNKGGNANIVKNPCLCLLNDLNRDALVYWRELCLTPSAFKRINEGNIKQPEAAGNALAAVLKDIREENAKE